MRPEQHHSFVYFRDLSEYPRDVSSFLAVDAKKGTAIRARALGMKCATLVNSNQTEVFLGSMQAGRFRFGG